MANPKRRHSKARTRARRSKYYSSIDAPDVMKCPNCGDSKMRHHACPNCGYYRGRKVVEHTETE